jgi:hypothetical protein
MVAGAYYQQATGHQGVPLNNREFSRAQRQLLTVFDEPTIVEAAKASGFTQRIRTITPMRLVLAVLVALGTRKTETIADIVRTFNLLAETNVAYKPFHKQLAKEPFGTFMQHIASHVINTVYARTLRAVPRSALARFSDIVIQDGSSFALHRALRDVYPGRFKKKGPAAAELHATMSVFYDDVISVSVAPDTQGERDFLPSPEQLRGCLLLADRGYQDIDYCADVAQAGGALIIRHQLQINPTLTQCFVQGRRIRRFAGRRLHDVLKTFRGSNVDLDGFWTRKGGRRVALRVLLLWDPKAKRHMVLVTNLPREDFDAKLVHTLYRIRWQVELMFKEWKSYANLHSFTTTKAPIAEGLIWGSLAAAILKRFLAHTAQRWLPNVETSTLRVARCIGEPLRELLVAIAEHRPVAEPLRRLLRFLSDEARRAHPTRDRHKGRLLAGLQPVHA